MTETSTETTAAPEPPKTLWQKASPWTIGVCGVIAAVGGLVQIYKAFSPHLPSCTADSTSTAVHDIFKGKNVQLDVFNDVKTLTDTSSEKTCQAHIETPIEIGTISYRLYWDDKQAKVIITKVDVKRR
jgi:hypothetical protein